MKKLTALFLILSLILCGCAGKPAETTTPGTEGVTEAPTTAPATEVPTEVPTDAVTEVPTEAPAEAPTEPPVFRNPLNGEILEAPMEGRAFAVTINNVRFLVVGVLHDDEDSLTALFSSGSSVAYIPYTTAVRMTSSVSSEVTSIYGAPPADGTVDSAAERLEELLLERFDDDEDAFSISSTNILEEAMADVTAILSILLGGIAAISLIVGGIGIMNIMLVTVTERTREIGIRKAIGATRGVILTQFLMEAVVICMMGCGLGIFLSWGILQMVTTVTASVGVRFVLDGTVVLVAVIFCFIIGVVFGLYPANKAARMKPIDALHYGG